MVKMVTREPASQRGSLSSDRRPEYFLCISWLLYSPRRCSPWRFNDSTIQRFNVWNKTMTFDPKEKALLGALADVLIPAGEGFPSASEAGVAAEGLENILSFRPDLAAGL